MTQNALEISKNTIQMSALILITAMRNLLSSWWTEPWVRRSHEVAFALRTDR